MRQADHNIDALENRNTQSNYQRKANFLPDNTLLIHLPDDPNQGND